MDIYYKNAKVACMGPDCAYEKGIIRVSDIKMFKEAVIKQEGFRVVIGKKILDVSFDGFKEGYCENITVVDENNSVLGGLQKLLRNGKVS